jgi:hypothetical protein
MRMWLIRLRVVRARNEAPWGRRFSKNEQVVCVLRNAKNVERDLAPQPPSLKARSGVETGNPRSLLR